MSLVFVQERFEEPWLLKARQINDLFGILQQFNCEGFVGLFGF